MGWAIAVARDVARLAAPRHRDAFVVDTAPKAAGVIHGDFERGFIKAETVSYDDLIACGNVAAARDAGKYRIEGKEYVVQDGDVLHFRFNV